MKKLLSSLLAVGILSTGVVAYANDNITEIEGPYTTGDIEVEIHMGFDATTPGPNPPNPDMWISVEIPTRVLIFSDGTTATPHSTFAVVNHTIRNFSARGVQVNIDNFVSRGTTTPITSLVLNGAGTTHTVMTNGSDNLSSGANLLLMTLASSPAGATNYTSATFNFTGTIDTNEFTHTYERADADLTLRLVPDLTSVTPVTP